MTRIPDFYPTIPLKKPVKENVVGKAREFINEIDESMENAGIYYSLGIMPEKTFILSSEPGLGKTLCVKALNNSKNSNLVKKIEEIKEKNLLVFNNQSEESISFEDFKMLLFEYDIGKYGTAYINMGSRTIQAFFDKCFEYSLYDVPILISIDECDALFRSRNSRIESHSEDRKVLETLMKNLQVAHDTPNIYIVMMTNVIDSIDEASIRAGRIDRRITFNMPNFNERKLAYNNAIKNINKLAGYKVIRTYSLEPLADISKGFSYADIYQSIEKSLREKAKELIKVKEPGIVRAGYIKQGKLEKAVLEHKKEFKKKQEKKIGFI